MRNSSAIRRGELGVFENSKLEDELWALKKIVTQPPSTESKSFDRAILRKWRVESYPK